MFRAEEDYVKAIYALTIEKDKSLVEVGELASYFGFTNQSVNDMIKKLQNKKLIKYQPYKGVLLTKSGLKEAVRLIRAHRLWEVFLTKNLKFNWSQVHDDAEQLEHVSSDKVIDALDNYLGNPKYCQHGNPIPNKEGNVFPLTTKSILDLNNDDKFKIMRVLDQKALLLYLDDLQIKLYDEFVVTNKDDFNGIISISNNDNLYVLSKEIASKIFVFTI